MRGGMLVSPRWPTCRGDALGRCHSWFAPRALLPFSSTPLAWSFDWESSQRGLGPCTGCPCLSRTGAEGPEGSEGPVQLSHAVLPSFLQWVVILPLGSF